MSTVFRRIAAAVAAAAMFPAACLQNAALLPQVCDASYKTIDASNAKITGVYLKTANTDTTEVTSAPTEPVTGSSEFTCGDVDGSGTVDVLDVIAVNKYLLGAKVLDKDAVQRADADQSGVTDASDSLLILKYVVELIDTLSAAA